MDYVGDLILLRGLPGCGKTTLGEVIMFLPGSNDQNNVISADDFFLDKNGVYNFDPKNLKEAHNDCLLRCVERMKNQLAKIVVANTFTQEWEMEKYFEVANRYNYRVHTVVVENRHESKNVHDVPEDKVKVMKNRFEIKLS